jgi:mRNA interferase MazF
MVTPLGGLRRGDVWLADLGEPVGHAQGNRRPAVIVSASRLNMSGGGLVIIVPFTRTRRPSPMHVEVEPGYTGLSETSYAKVQDVRSVSVDRLIKKYGSVSLDSMQDIGRMLTTVLDLHRLPDLS